MTQWLCRQTQSMLDKKSVICNIFFKSTESLNDREERHYSAIHKEITKRKKKKLWPTGIPLFSVRGTARPVSVLPHT